MNIKLKKTIIATTLTLPLVLVTACSGGDTGVVDFNTGTTQAEELLETPTQETQGGGFKLPDGVTEYVQNVDLETPEQGLNFIIQSYQESIDKSNQVLSYTTNPDEKTYIEKIIKENTERQQKIKNLLTKIDPTYQDDGTYTEIMKDYTQPPSAMEDYVNDLINHNITVIMAVSPLLSQSSNLPIEDLQDIADFVPQTREQNKELNEILKTQYNTSNEIVDYNTRNQTTN